MKNSNNLPILRRIYEFLATGWLKFKEMFKSHRIGLMSIELMGLFGRILKFLFLHPYTLLFIVLLQKLWLIFVVLFFAYAPLSGTDQAHDIFYSLLRENSWWQFWAYITVFIFAITTWFTCRMLFIFFDLEKVLERTSKQQVAQNQNEFLRDLVRWAPPFIGLVPFYILFSKVTESPSHFFCLALELAVYFIILSVNKDFIKMEIPDITHESDYLSLREHPYQKLRVRYKILIVLGYILCFGIFIVFSFNNTGISRHIGTVAVYFIGMAFWVYMAFTLLLLDNLHRAPITILSFFILLFLLNTNNHQIRILEPKYFSKKDQLEPLTIPEHFKKWLIHRKDSIVAEKRKGIKYPIYIIATEGGGIRAAYWTASVLGELSKLIPGFMHHTYAISGVSGGAVGATVFTTLYHDSLYKAQKQNVGESSLKIIGKDFLSPLAAAFLIPDMAQKISPVGIKSFDRARYLEDALSKDYFDEMGVKSLETPFMGIWNKKKIYTVPSLFLNCTRVETGEKAIITNLLIKDDKNFSSGENNKSVIDLQEEIARHISVSTAAFIGARFPIVTPPATVQYPDVKGDDRYNIVDGGYIDNSGLETALSIMSSIRNSREYSNLDPLVQLHLILIKNSEQGENGVNAVKGIYELKAPLMAFFNSWDIHIVSKLNVAHEYLKLSNSNDKKMTDSQTRFPIDSLLTVFALDRKQCVIPLGWFLSENARNCLNGQKDYLRISLKSSKNLEKLRHFKPELTGTTLNAPENLKRQLYSTAYPQKNIEKIERFIEPAHLKASPHE